jgi:hypothetical protein
MRFTFRIDVSILFIWMLVISCMAPVPAQSNSISAPRQPRRLELLRSNQPDFEPSIDANYPGLRQLDGFEAIKPLLVMLRNNSEHGIKAFVIKWSVVEATGRRFELTRSPWAGTSASGTLAGERIIWNPGEARLASPSFDWGIPGPGIESKAKLISAMSKGRLATDASASLNIDIWLDAVVYDDGVFGGPDKGNFYDRYECQQKGEQDEGAFALSLVELNLSDGEIVARLNADVEKARGHDESDRASLLDAARAMEARALLTILNRYGRSGLKTFSLRLARAERTILRRQ